MRSAVATRFSAVTLAVTLGLFGAACGSSNDSTGPSPILSTETFTGTLQPLGTDFKTFTVAFTAAPTELSVVVNTLTTVANSTPVTGITIGVGFGGVSSGACSVQIGNPAATLGQELFVPNGASAGTYCVLISDCPAGATGCTSRLTEPVTYSMTVKHY
jgi:hypothetical protein